MKRYLNKISICKLYLYWLLIDPILFATVMQVKVIYYNWPLPILHYYRQQTK